jgi:hypothetical protein
MAFIPEDGTGVPGANSYATVDYALNYFAERGRASEFAGGTEQQQGWLVQSTSYIELRFSDRFLLAPFSLEQGLSFPRGVVNGTAIVSYLPWSLVQATCEYAVRAKLGPLAPDPVVDATGLTVVMTSREVGPLKRAFAVAPGSKPQTFRSYPAADALIAPLLMGRVRQVIR